MLDGAHDRDLGGQDSLLGAGALDFLDQVTAGLQATDEGPAGASFPEAGWDGHVVPPLPRSSRSLEMLKVGNDRQPAGSPRG